jgi:flavin-binding protein dodecin
MVGLEVMGQTGVVEGGKIVEYRSNVKVAFVVEEVRG